MLRIALVLSWSIVALVAVEHRAHAIAACGNGEGWALASGATIPTHGRLVYYMDGRRNSGSPPTIAATIDGKSVSAKLSITPAPPFALAMIDIDSDKTGQLVLTWGGATQANGYFSPAEPSATYTVSSKLKLPGEAKGIASRFHQAYRHSTVHEIDDGLEVRVDVPAIAFTARYRRDDRTPWATLELTATTVDGHQVARLGSLGCSSNFPVTTLEAGIDLELVAMLPDGKLIKVTGFPAHYTLPKLPAGAPQSSP